MGNYFISYADILDSGSVHEGLPLCGTVVLSAVGFGVVAGEDGGQAASLRAEKAGGRDKVGSKMSVGVVGRVGGWLHGRTDIVGRSGLSRKRVKGMLGRRDWMAGTMARLLFLVFTVNVLAMYDPNLVSWTFGIRVPVETRGSHSPRRIPLLCIPSVKLHKQFVCGMSSLRQLHHKKK